MNRVYKVIWSKAKHCYVVTSEIAKSYTKGESTGRGLKKLAAALLVAAALMGPNFAWAAGDTVTVKDTTEVEQIVYTQKGADDQFATKTDLAAKANAADVENTYAKTADVANTYVNKTNAQVTNLTVYRDVEAYGNLQVGNGNFTVSGITGNVTTGYATIGDDLTVKGDTEMKGDLSVKGTLNAADGKFSVGNDGQLSVSSGKFIVDTNGGINIGQGTATIDNNGNITGKKLDVGDTTVKSLDAGNGLIQTTGTVKAGDVQTGTLKAGATTVDSLDAGSGLIKTNGDISGTNITGTNITGDNVVVNDKLTTKNLAVTGGLEMNHITLGSEPTDNYTEINMGNVTSKNSKLSVDDGRTYTSTSNLTEKGRTNTAADGTTTNVSVMTAGGSDSTISSLADKNQKSYITQNMKNILQGIKNGANESIINQTETGIKSIATDTDGKNNASTNLSNKGFNTFASDGGKNKTYTKQTAESLTSQIGDDGKVKSVMNADGITNNADGGTITNSAKDLVNTATGNMTNTVGGKLLNDVTGDMENKVGGNLTTTVGGSQTTTVTGDSSLTAENITNEAKNKITNKAIDVETDATSSIVQKVTNDAGSNTSTQWSYQTMEEMSQTDGKTASYLRGAVEEKSQLIDGDKKTTIDTIAGQTNTNITEGKNVSNSLQKADQIASSVTDGTNTTVVNQNAGSLASSITAGTKVNNTNNTIDKSEQQIRASDTQFSATSKTATKMEDALVSGDSVIDVMKNLDDAANPFIGSAVTDGTNITAVTQTAKDITNTAEKGTIANNAKDITNHATENMTNTVDNNLTTTVGGNETRTVKGTLTETVTGNVTEDYKADLSTKVGGNETHAVTGNQTVTVSKDRTVNVKGTETENFNAQVTNVKTNQQTSVGGKQTNIVGGDQQNTVSGSKTETVNKAVTEKYGSQATTVNGDQSTNVGGNQSNVVKGNQTNTISGSKTESVKGAVTETYGSQSTTVNGNQSNTVKGTLTETVTGNVTEDYKANLDTTVGGNETRTVEGTLTETVTGDVTEDYKANLDTNVTGDSSLKAKNIHNTANEALTNDANTITNKAHESVTTQIGNGTTVKSVMDVNGIANTASTGTITNYAVTITNTGVASVTNQVSDNKVLVDTNQVKSAFGDTIYTTWDADGITNITGNNTVISDNGGTTFANEDAKTPFAEGGKTGTRVNTKITGNKVETGKVLTDFAEVANNLDVKGSTTTGTLRVEKDGYVGGDLNVEGNIETHDAVLSADSRQVVTGRQLYQTNERVDRLDNRIKKVGANAAALAALRPGDFNPDDKFSIAAGFGSYRNANAAALGLFYRPNENVLLSLGTSFGDGENMVNAGVSVKFGRGKSMAERRKEMADEVSSMRDEMRSQDERIAELEEMLKKQSELIEKLSKES